MTDIDQTTPLDIVQELVTMFNEAREQGCADITSCVGSRFEQRVNAVWARDAHKWLEEA